MIGVARIAWRSCDVAREVIVAIFMAELAVVCPSMRKADEKGRDGLICEEPGEVSTLVASSQAGSYEGA
jgi:hypothetical protein